MAANVKSGRAGSISSAGAGSTGPVGSLAEIERQELRRAALWWFPGGLTGEAPTGGPRGVAAILETVWLPLAVTVAGATLLALAVQVVLGSAPVGAFLLWFVYLSATLVMSRYGQIPSVLGAGALLVHAMVIGGLDLTGFQPTVFFAITIVGLGASLGASHAALVKRAAEQTFAFQQYKAMAGTRPEGPANGTGASVLASLGTLAAAPTTDAACEALEQILRDTVGVETAEIWNVDARAGRMTLTRNLGPGTVQEGTTVDAAGDPFLAWFLGEKRVVTFHDRERTALRTQFGETLPSPLLPLAGLGPGGRLQGLLRITASSRQTFGPEDGKLLAAIASVAEEALVRLNALGGASRE